MAGPRIDLRDVHNALSHLLFALREEFPFAIITLTYDGYVGLSAILDVPLSKRQLAIDRLNVGVLNGDYDYRFSVVSHSPRDMSPTVRVEAVSNLDHHRRKKD